MVLVHAQSGMPHPEDGGVMVRPGQYSLLGLSKTIVTRQPHPYSTCVSRHDTSRRVADAYEKLFPVGYGRIGCLKTCSMKLTIGDCRCVAPQYHQLAVADDIVVPICDVYNGSTRFCMEALKQPLGDKEVHCDCPEACDEETFNSVVSHASWPIANNNSEAIAQIKSSFPGMFAESKSAEADAVVVKSNFLRFGVYFEKMYHGEIRESPVYTWAKYISDIGSCMGLWLGCSLLTLLEFVELFVKLTLPVVWRKCGLCRSKISSSPIPLSDKVSKGKAVLNTATMPSTFAQPLLTMSLSDKVKRGRTILAKSTDPDAFLKPLYSEV